MVQCGGGLGLVDEASAPIGICEFLLGQQFYRDQPSQPRIPRLVDPAHTAHTNLLQKGEVAKLAGIHGLHSNPPEGVAVKGLSLSRILDTPTTVGDGTRSGESCR